MAASDIGGGDSALCNLCLVYAITFYGSFRIRKKDKRTNLKRFAPGNGKNGSKYSQIFLLNTRGKALKKLRTLC